MGAVPKLGIEGEDADGVWDALDFIRIAKRDSFVPGLGDTVAVIAAEHRDRRRHLFQAPGREFRDDVLSPRPERMTAYDFEIEFAKSEAVEFRYNVLPHRIITSGGRVTGLELIRTDPGGTARPIPGSEYTIPVDNVIPAIASRSSPCCSTRSAFRTNTASRSWISTCARTKRACLPPAIVCSGRERAMPWSWKLPNAQDGRP